MLAVLALSAALAAPEGIPWDDADVWESRWTEIYRGPPGCWEVTGRATWAWDAGRFGSNKGNAAFAGILHDGVWRDVIIRSLGERTTSKGEAPVVVYPHGEVRFIPLVGRPSAELTRQEDVQKNVLMAVLDEIGGDVVTSWSDWDEGRKAVVLHREIPVRGGSRATMEVLFPAGVEQPQRLDLTFAQPFSLPDRRAVRVRDAEAHIRARNTVGMTFPEAEALEFGVSVLGFQGHGAQTIRYHAFRPCGGDSASSTPALKP